ncbi:MAG TPA: hypothetical protein GX687_04295 [Clostridia bacterium]|nr:hypothetical protein [Clostridia bacterium]
MKLDKGVFVLSLDTELAWGMRDKPKAVVRNKRYYEKTHKVINEILNLMINYNISATWAIVGKLF